MTAVAVTMTATLAAPTSATSPPSPADPVAEYVDYLTATAASDRRAAEVLDDFQALSPEDQAAFVDYVSDPSVTEELGEVPINSTIVSHDGDIVTTATATTTSTLVRPSPRATGLTGATIAATSYNVTSTYSVSQKILGVTVTKLSQTFRYVTGSNRVLRTTSCMATAVNYNFVMNIDDKTDPYMLGNEAQCDTVWTGYLLFKGAAIRMDKMQSLRVGGAGIVWKQLVNA